MRACLSISLRERERERERGKHAQGRPDNFDSIAAVKFGWIGWNDRPFALPFPPDPAPMISPSLLHAFGLDRFPQNNGHAGDKTQTVDLPQVSRADTD